MRKILLCLTALILFAGSAFAQRGLSTKSVLNGKIIPKKWMEVTEVRGGEITNYKLEYYKSVRFQTGVAMVREVAALVEADADAAVSAEREKVGDLLTYALIQPRSVRKANRYLCYQARQVLDDVWVVTILYLEGMATMEDLRSMFEPQNETEE